MRWWRVFIDKLSGKDTEESEVEGRRRRHERYGYEVKLAAKCSSWPKFVELFTGDLSEGGLFVPTEEDAEVGEAVQLDLTLPNGTTVALTGQVANVTDARSARKQGKPAGIGIMFDPLAGTSKEILQKLLATARAHQPRPADTLESGQPEPPSPRHESKAEIQAGPLGHSAVQQVIQSEENRELSEASPLPDPPPPPPTKPLARSPSAGPIIGIDLGTTNSSVAAVVGQKVSLLGFSDGAKFMPSVVSFERDGTPVVGQEARRRIATAPMRTISSPKRVLGRGYSEREVQTFVGQTAYRCSEGPDGSITVEIAGKQYAIPQIISYILRELRDLAEARLGERVEQAVVSVPISFEEHRIEALRRAGKLAGLEVVAVIDEPSAAALANRFDPNFGGVVGVYDFGGGTFDFSVVDVSRGDFQVLATAGDTWLGGDDFDRVLAEAAANQFWRQHKVDLRNQAMEWQRLLFACEKAKRHLSATDRSVISVPDVLRTAEGMIGLNLTINRSILDRACAAIIQRSLDTCDEALALLGMRPSELSTVYLSGGTTYVPAVREALARHFGVEVRTGVPPEHAVCLGAAIHAAQVQFRARQTLETR